MIKKIYKFLTVALLASSLVACEDVNDKFDGLDEGSKPTNVISVTKEMTSDDYAKLVTILTKLNRPEDAEAIKYLKANNAFSDIAPAEVYVPYLFPSLYYSADKGSNVALTYDNKTGIDAQTTSYTGKAHVLGNDDYKQVWGDIYTNSFSPLQSPSKHMNAILKRVYPDAKAGDAKNVSYFYSKDEPTTVTSIGKTYLKENFETVTVPNNIVLKDWINVDLKGSFAWQARSFNSNLYANVSSFKSGMQNDIWFITPKTKLDDKANLKFTFDVNVRNYTASCLTVLVSENFDGTEAGIKTATWTNVSSSFNIPSANMTEMASAGVMAMDKYKGKTIHIAFRYEGDETPGVTPLRTTTYQVDNVVVYEGVTGIEVKEKALQYGLYSFDGTTWTVVNDNTVVVLQPEDYTTMAESKPIINMDNARKKVPTYLKAKFPYELEFPNGESGDRASKTVVYYTANNEARADKFTLTKGVWVPQKKTAQFILTADGWVFDPTFVIDFKGNKGAYQQIVNYVKVNQGIDNPALIDSRGNAEFYYGFNAFYPNVTYREKDRVFDPVFAALTTNEARVALMNKRTVEGLIAYLVTVYPTATAEVSGIEQTAIVQNVLIYSDPLSTITNQNFTYILKCVGDKQWKGVSRQLQGSSVIEDLTQQ